jgi:hypothetical protein
MSVYANELWNNYMQAYEHMRLMPTRHLSYASIWCHWPWGSIRAGTHVSCATGQESIFCLHTSLDDHLFDLMLTPFHFHHSIILSA